MSYKTIVVHVDHSRHAEQRLRHAARLAVQYDAHLIGCAFTGISRYAGVDVGVELAMMMPSTMGEVRERNAKSLDRFDAIAASEGVNSAERRMMEDDPGGGLALVARYADLTVVSQTDLAEPASAHYIGGFPEQLVLDGGRPALIIPYIGHFDTIGQRPLIAWDGSLEATRAVFNALPLLRRAAKTTVVTYALRHATEREPGADLALYLARHGINCEVRSSPLQLREGEQLLSLAADIHADCIVMGCYGHSRLRELMLGGVSEAMFSNMTVPLLMSH